MRYLETAYDWFAALGKFQQTVVVALVSFAILMPLGGSKPRTRFVGSPEYVWPVGCKEKPVSFGADLPCACADERYRVDYNELGLHKMGRGPAVFYRIDTAAVQIDRYSADRCVAPVIYDGTFNK